MSAWPQVPDHGPFRWKLAAGERDRLRLGLHRAVFTPPNMLRMRGGPRLSLWLRAVVGGYAAPLQASSDDICVSFDGFDRYWMRVFFRGDFYEPDLFHFFKRLARPRDYHFIDGGANIGLWSAILTSNQFGITRAVAIEASRSTYPFLLRTATLCGSRFATEHRALGDVAGTVVFDEALPPASRHVVTDLPPSATRVEVASTTIDSIIQRYELNPSNLIVKLDVEGAELACIRGAARAFDAGAIFVYEDHGKDPRSVVTDQLLQHGALCWFIDDAGQLHDIRDAGTASSFKTERGRGYNFLCTSRAHALEHPLHQRLFGPA